MVPARPASDLYYRRQRLRSLRNMPTDKPEQSNIAVLVTIFTVVDGSLRVLLIQRSAPPDEGKWAIPGGALSPHESLDNAATRKLAQETGVTDVFLEQLYTFSNLDKKRTGGSAAVTYFALVSDDRVHLARRPNWKPDWFPFDELPTLALNNEQVLDAARTRLINKLEYTNAAYSLLPAFFTMTQLQQVYESILGRSLDKRNFRRRILASDLLIETNRTIKTGPHRPARLYRFTNRKPVEL